MAELRGGNVQVYIIGDFGLVEPHDFTLTDLEAPENMLFCCFFKSEDERSAFLGNLKQLVMTQSGEQQTDLEIRLGDDARKKRQRSEAFGLMVNAIEWWTGVKKQGYHAYRLVAEVLPYRNACIIAFKEAQREELQLALYASLDQLQNTRNRVAGMLGLPVDD